jgi:hypothetical protein
VEPSACYSRRARWQWGLALLISRVRAGGVVAMLMLVIHPSIRPS